MIYGQIERNRRGVGQIGLKVLMAGPRGPNPMFHPAPRHLLYHRVLVPAALRVAILARVHPVVLARAALVLLVLQAQALHHPVHLRALALL